MNASLRAEEELATRLQSRREEIEGVVLARVHSISDPLEVEDPSYAAGLREAVSTALDYAIGALQDTGSEQDATPPTLLAQARAAARNGVSLDTVLRRYFVGYTALGEFLMREARGGESFDLEELQRLSRTQAAVFDQVIATISAAYTHEAKARVRDVEGRRLEQVRKLLAGELLGSADFAYELGRWHLGAIVSGPGAHEAARELARQADRGPLLVKAGEQVTWAWLGGASRLPAAEVAKLATEICPPEVSLALGEPAHGISGWRLTHRQAQAAAQVAASCSQRVTCYADVALLATALRDEVLRNSLQEIFLAPLTDERDGGAALFATLRAYIASGQHVSAAAAALGISRQTVNSRLRTVEERIGRSVQSCVAELSTALRLQELPKSQAS